jgi:hypothetical protein
MKYRATKAAGSFDCSKPGTFELLVNMEADPHTLSYATFSFEDELPTAQAEELALLPAFLLRHGAGPFVICVEPTSPRHSRRYQSAWQKLDVILARRGIWLFATTAENLRREPHWSNALQIARCARSFALSDQKRVVSHLSDVGHDSIRSCMKLCAASVDSFDALLGLVSAGIIYLDRPDDLSPGATLSLNPPDLPSVGWLSAHNAELR